jgi:hydroxyacylglutathione hydrolase
MIQYKSSQICVFESALFRTTSAVIQTSDLVLVVDPNWLPQEVSGIRHFIDSIKESRPVFLLFTHSDYDHIIGYRAFPGVTVIASAAFASNPEKEQILEQIHKFDDEYYILRDYPIEYPKVDIIVEADGQELRVGGTRLVFYLAPGHNRDGIFTLVDPPGCWIAGDYLCNVEFPYIYHSSYEYEKTLDKAERIINDYQPALFIPGHGDVSDSPTEMKERLLEARSYIRELRECIRQDRSFPMEKLWERYRFPIGMKAFHEANVKLMMEEERGK